MDDLRICDGVTLCSRNGRERGSNDVDVIRGDGKVEVRLSNFSGSIILDLDSAGLLNKPPVSSRLQTSTTPSWLQSWVDEAKDDDRCDKKRPPTSGTSPNGKKSKRGTPSVAPRVAMAAGAAAFMVTPYSVIGKSNNDWLGSTPGEPLSAMEAHSKHYPVTPITTFTENSAKICVERQGHAMFYTGDTIYVHGGEDAQGLTMGDVLAFRATPGDARGKDLFCGLALGLTRALCDSQRRSWHTSQFLAESKLLVVFGGECREAGSDRVAYPEDCLVFDATIELWYPACVSGKGPSARSGCSSGLVGRSMVVYGGHKDYRYLHNIHVLDTERWHWSSPKCDGPPPSARAGHSCTYIGANRLLVFGGSNGWDSYNDVHVLSSNDRGSGWTWEKVAATGELPRARARHTALALAEGRLVLIRGGSVSVENAVDGGKEAVFFDDAFILDTLHWAWTRVEDAAGGGYSSVAYSKTFLEADHTQSAICSPRSGEAVASVSTGEGKTYLAYFGGSIGAGKIDSSLYCVPAAHFL